MNQKAVFFDRDGTLNLDPGYLGDPDKVELYKGVPDGIKALKEKGFLIIVISNQSGIARRLITPKQVEAVNSKINSILSRTDSTIDKFYYCPYHPEFSPMEKCACRKPSPLMIQVAADENNVDLNMSYMVGDSAIDIECGINAGVETILVLNGKNEEQINLLKKRDKRANFVAGNFFDACQFILDKHAEDSV